MKVWPTLFCFLFIAPQDGNTGLFNSNSGLRKRLEGEDIVVACQFSISGSTKLFCRNKCEEGNVLIETTKNNEQRGRYSIEYEEKGIELDDVMYVTIKQLKKSDSGRYRCALERSWHPDSSCDFEIVVREAPTTSKPDVTLGPFPPSAFLPAASTAATPTEQGLSSSSGGSKPPSTSSESTEQLDSPPSRSDLQLYVGLILVVKVFILSMPLMIFCKKRRSTRPKGPPVETDHIYVSESSRVIEEIREEDGQSSSPPVEIFSIYCNAKYTKPNGAEDASAQPAGI